MEKLFVCGHGGMVGQAILARLARDRAQGDGGPLVMTRSRAQLELTDQAAVRDFLAAERPDAVILAAAKVGGIAANDRYPAQFIYENLMIEANVIHQAWAAGVGRLLFVGSSCIYPPSAPQPLREDALLSGRLEPTNEPYAVAKIAGIKLCESYNRQYGVDYRAVIAANLYGPGDNFHPDNSHVLPALLRRFHAARAEGLASVTVWGTGAPRREFLHVEDMADASLFVMGLDRQTYGRETRPMVGHINVGSGTDVSIGELARIIARVVGYEGQIVFDPDKPDGAPRKLMDVSRLRRLGWQARIGLEQGIRQTYQWLLAQGDKGLRQQ